MSGTPESVCRGWQLKNVPTKFGSVLDFMYVNNLIKCIFFQILEISYHNYKMIRLNKKNIMQRDSKKCGIGRRLLESSFGFK